MLKFDELNQLKRFFSTMELSEDKKKQRCDFAYLLYDAIFYTFAEINAQDLNITHNELKSRIEEAFEQEGVKHTPEYIDRLTGNILSKPDYDTRNIIDTKESEVVKDVLSNIKAENFNAEPFRQTLTDRLTETFDKEGIPYEPNYIPKLVDEIIQTTNRHPDDPYYLSKDRALLIAQNESNTAYNHADYETARQSGKNYKVWITEGDEKVREAHVEVDMMRIPINEMFSVGNDMMRYPHDFLNGSAENLVNCRCVCTYE